MLVVVGRIGRAHGLRGEVAIDVRTDEPETRFAPGSVLLTAPGRTGSVRPAAATKSVTPKTLTVQASRWHSSRLLVRFEGVDDRTKAEAIQGLSLTIDLDPAAPTGSEDEFYDIELEGMQVVTSDGSAVGTLASVLHLPAQDLLAITKPDGTEVLVPFVKELVPSVNRATRTIVVVDPGGLLDDSEAEQ